MTMGAPIFSKSIVSDMNFVQRLKQDLSITAISVVQLSKIIHHHKQFYNKSLRFYPLYYTQ